MCVFSQTISLINCQTNDYTDKPVHQQVSRIKENGNDGEKRVHEMLHRRKSIPGVQSQDGAQLVKTAKLLFPSWAEQVHAHLVSDASESSSATEKVIISVILLVRTAISVYQEALRNSNS